MNNIFSITPETFTQSALAVFHFQYENNALYKRWVDIIGTLPSQVNELTDIPFLPVSFFKTDEVVTGQFLPEVIFESSGTSQTQNSRHLVKDVSVYSNSFLKGFEQFYGDIGEWSIIGLLPAYLERSGSSLIMMVDELINQSGHDKSGFYLYDFEKLSSILESLEKSGQKTLLIGVTFALLDFAEQYPMRLENTIVMETGGMKGRRKEMTRQEVHDILTGKLGVNKIHSEYGMTELLSQAYSIGDGIFSTVPWMKVLVREEDDPLSIRTIGRGIINVIDLANVHSCSFIATDDVGHVSGNGQFEVSGRMDTSDIRGCSLMVL